MKFGLCYLVKRLQIYLLNQHHGVFWPDHPQNFKGHLLEFTFRHQEVFWLNHGRLINGPFCQVYLLSMPHVVITSSFLCLPPQFGRVLRTCHSQILRTWAFCRTSRRRANSWTQRSGWRKGSASCGELKTETNSIFYKFFHLFSIQSLHKIRSQKQSFF